MVLHPPPMDVPPPHPQLQMPYDAYYGHHHHPHLATPLPETAIGHPNLEQQRIHTLFVSGLPDDVKAREIHNLFRRRPDFDYCLLEYTGRGNQVVAFAKFFSHHSAMVAMNELNGVTFDPQTGATLHIELARSNSRNKRPRGGGAYVIIDKRSKVTKDDEEAWTNDGGGAHVIIDKRAKVTKDDWDAWTNDEDGGSDDPLNTDDGSTSNKDASATAQSDGEMALITANAQVAPNELSEKTRSGDILPCSTLFIANLGPTCTEDELKEALSGFPGFRALKMRGRVGMPVAFADFEDVESSTEAMKGLQDKLLKSSDRGGLYLEYAKSKMRMG